MVHWDVYLFFLSIFYAQLPCDVDRIRDGGNSTHSISQRSKDTSGTDLLRENCIHCLSLSTYVIREHSFRVASRSYFPATGGYRKHVRTYR